MDIWRPLPLYWFKHVVGLFKYIHSMTCFYRFCGLLSTIMTLWSASHSPDWPLSLFYRLTLHLHFVVVPISLLFRTARIILLLFYSITLLISCMKLLRLFNFLLFLLLNSMYVLYTFGFLIVCFFRNIFRTFSKRLHCSRKWNSSPRTLPGHIGQVRNSLGVPSHLPTSIGRLWLLVLNLVSVMRFLKHSISRHSGSFRGVMVTLALKAKNGLEKFI